MMKTINNSLPVPPGATLLEQMEEKKMTLSDLAEKLVLTIEQTKCLLAGEAVLMQTTAKRLEEIGMVTESFWMKLEHQYRKALFELIVDLDQAETMEMYESSFLNDYVIHSFEVVEEVELPHDSLFNGNRNYKTIFKSTDGMYTAILTVEVFQNFYGEVNEEDDLVFADNEGNNVTFKYIEDDLIEYLCEFSIRNRMRKKKNEELNIYVSFLSEIE